MLVKRKLGVMGTGRRVGLATVLLVLPLVLGVASAGGRTLAVTPVIVQVIGKGTITSDPAGLNCGNGATTCYLASPGAATSR